MHSSPLKVAVQHAMRAVFVLIAAVLALPNGILHAQAYTNIVVFGDSLSDTGNDTVVSAQANSPAYAIPAPQTGYTYGRFTDGGDTVPSTQMYAGVWIEQVAAQLAAHPAVVNSLANGTNYAFGFATTDIGTSNFAYGPNNVLSFNVENMGQQVTDYLNTNPKITNKTLFVIWGGANDLIAATTATDIINAASRDVALMQRLINAGATDFLIPNLPPLGLVPRFNGSATTSAGVTAAASAFNQAQTAVLAQLVAANAGKSLNVYSLDIATIFNTIVATPSNYGFVDVTDMSQGNPAIKPDTYLFWDSLHPTTAGHHLIAASALRLMGTPVQTSNTVTSSNTSANLNSSVTFTAKVANLMGTSDTPMGTVTFLDGGSAIGTGFLTGSGPTAMATLTTSTLAAGAHTISTMYLGVNGFASSTASNLSQTVVPPTYSATISPSVQSIPRGGSALAAITITPSGGYTGSFKLACGSLPAHFSCAFQSSSLSITGSSSVSSTVLFSTSAATSEMLPLQQHNITKIVFAIGGLPFFGLLTLCARRQKFLSRTSTMLLALVSLCAFAGLCGCSSDRYANDTPSGTYQIPVTVTPATGTATPLTFTVVVQ